MGSSYSRQKNLSLKYFYQNGAYLGAWISLPNALNLYHDNQFSEKALLLFSTLDQTPLTSYEELNITAKQYQDEAYMHKHYLSLSVPLDTSALNLTLLIPYDVVFKNLNIVFVVEALILLCIILCIPFFLHHLKRLILHPIFQLVTAMHEVRGGNYTVSVPENHTVQEFDIVNTSFNSMIAEINHLKVDIYEKEIFNQQLELEKLQQQVKSHFYLNCLNIIYNLAEGEEYKLIQSLCMAQADYFRYMLKSAFKAVAIKDEFSHIENYLHIQQLRYPDRFCIDLTLDSEFENIHIPPLLLHVFTENVVKHATALGKLHFSINTRIYDDYYIEILIRDDGPGFPPDVLAKLNAGESLSNGNGQHIGISSTVKRLHLFYHGKARITFSNQRPHGASIQILIPRKETDYLEHTNN